MRRIDKKKVAPIMACSEVVTPRLKSTRLLLSLGSTLIVLLSSMTANTQVASPGTSCSCTSTTTITLPPDIPIPVLNRYSLVLLSLLILGIGVIGFRRVG